MQQKETASRAVGSNIFSQHRYGCDWRRVMMPMLTMTIMVVTVVVTVAETVIVVTMTMWVMS